MTIGDDRPLMVGGSALKRSAQGGSNGVFLAICIFGMGLLLGLDTLVSQAYGEAGSTNATGGSCTAWRSRWHLPRPRRPSS